MRRIAITAPFTTLDATAALATTALATTALATSALATAALAAAALAATLAISASDDELSTILRLTLANSLLRPGLLPE